MQCWVSTAMDDDLTLGYSTIFSCMCVSITID